MLQRRSEPPSQFLLILGDKVKQARHQRGWSQQKLAEAALLRRATINDVENGKTNPTIDTLLSISAALEVPLISLIPLPPEERAKQDELPDWMREALIHMRYITDERIQRQIIAMLKAAAEEEISEAHEVQDREVLKELNERVERGEKLPPQMKKLWGKLKERYE
jgi:transcriptional regulator with XRE-family HTH domain